MVVLLVTVTVVVDEVVGTVVVVVVDDSVVVVVAGGSVVVVVSGSVVVVVLVVVVTVQTPNVSPWPRCASSAGSRTNFVSPSWHMITQDSLFVFILTLDAPVGSFVVLLNRNSTPTSATNKTVIRTIAEAFFPLTVITVLFFFFYLVY